MKTISSRQNAMFKRVHDAVREHGEEIVIEGPKAVADAIDAGWRPVLLVIPTLSASEEKGPGGAAGTHDDRQRGALPAQVPPLFLRYAQGQGRDDEVVVFSEALFNDISDTRTSQGIVALFERPRSTLDDVFARGDSVVVALDAVQDPGNVGTIVRLAAAFDAAGVALLPGCADPFGPKAIRASAGAILSVPCAPASHGELLARGWPLFAADARGEPIDPPSGAAILAFGSEGSGVSEVIGRAARKIAVPISRRVESLNVAAAAAILLSRSFALR